MSNFRQRLLIFAVPLLLALPFLNRAYFVDDNYFVEIAQWLKENPSLPYHFRADDAGPQNRGWEENGFVRMVNPLAHQYYLSILLRVSASEWFLRLGCVLLSCFSALFLFELARRWTHSPALATLAVMFTPAFWLSSYSLLIDSTMTFFALGAIYFFIRSTETGHALPLVASGVFAGLAILSKYPAVFVLPLMLLWLALRWKKLSRHWMYFMPMLIGGAFLVAYSAWTAHLYGRPHILAASARMVGAAGWPKIFSFAVFFSGALLAPLVAWAAATARARVFAALAAFLFAVFLSSKLGGFTRAQSALLGVWIVTSFLFAFAMWRSRAEWVFPRDHFLALWVGGFVAMMLVVMDWVAARYFCLVAPAVGFFAVRLIEMRWREAAPKILKPLLVALFVVSGSLAVVDYQQAEPSRLIGPALRAKGVTGGDRHFYLGDSFTMSYMKQEGWVPCFPQTPLQAGDLILAKEVTMPLVWFGRRPYVVNELERISYPSSLPLKVMDYRGSAGFYASVWGALPFTFSTGPAELYRLFEIKGVLPQDAP